MLDGVVNNHQIILPNIDNIDNVHSLIGFVVMHRLCGGGSDHFHHIYIMRTGLTNMIYDTFCLLAPSQKP